MAEPALISFLLLVHPVGESGANILHDLMLHSGGSAFDHRAKLGGCFGRRQGLHLLSALFFQGLGGYKVALRFCDS